jgi:hypothetical protein
MEGLFNAEVDIWIPEMKTFYLPSEYSKPLKDSATWSCDYLIIIIIIIIIIFILCISQ